MSQPMNMMGGPVHNSGTPSDAHGSDVHRQKLNTYIYDYFLKNGNYEIARVIFNKLEIQLSPTQKQSPNRKDVNGVNDSMDTDLKDDKKPDDLPAPMVPDVSGGSFLYDWWYQFWECFNAQHGKGNAQTGKYLNNVQARMANDRQRLMRVDPQMQANMAMRPGMMQNAMQVPKELAQKMAIQQGRQPTPQQMAQMQQYRMQQQMLQQNAMQREGSSMDQRPASPGGDNAPSPKRQRLDGGFNGGPMGPMGRGQPQGMPGQQMANPQAKAMQQVYAQSMRQHVQSAMDSNVNKGVMPNGAPAMPQDPNAADFFNANAMRAMPSQGPANSQSNHALQDYQMQLMLLEQQNKKRLLMARQEQDNMTNGPNGPVPQGQNFGPQAMSPSNSRAGPSPGPNEQMRRGTPKMAPGVVPSPTADGAMQGRASPAPGQFDPNNPMNPAMAFPMGGKMMMGPNGQVMQPPSSHPPGFGQMTPQQMELFRQQQQRNGQAQMANGFMPQPGPNMMGGQQQPQQPPNMTPQQRNAAMPPPPAPAGGDGPRSGTQPSSPSQVQAPPTPSQGNKGTKSKKDSKASATKPGNKKGNTGATPSESEQPPTPTPAPPITPQPNQGFPPKPGQPPNQQQQNQPQNGQNMSGQSGDMGGVGGPFGNMDNDFSSMGLEFEMGGPDVLDNFDFDSFLTNDAGADGFGFDPSGMNFGTDGGLEAGGDV